MSMTRSAAELRKARIEAKFSQGLIARYAGINRSTLSLIENGYVEASPNTISAIESAIKRAIRESVLRLNYKLNS